MRRYKIPGFLVMALLLVAMMCLVSSPREAKAKAIELKVVSLFPSEDNQNLHGWRVLKKLVNEQAKGELVLKYIGGPEVVRALEQPEATRKGVVDMCITGTAYIGNVVPAGLALNLTTNTWVEQRKVGLNDLMIKEYSKGGLFFLGRTNFLRYNLYTTKLVEKLTGLKELKARSIPTYEPYYRALGIIGVTMSNQEAYTALERGIINALTTPSSMPVAMRWVEILKYRVGPPFMVTDMINLINQDKWSKIPKHLQDLFISCQIKAEGIDWEYWQKENERHLTEQVEKYGIKQINFSDAESRQFLDAVYSSTWGWIEEKCGKELTARIRALSGAK